MAKERAVGAAVGTPHGLGQGVPTYSACSLARELRQGVPRVAGAILRGEQGEWAKPGEGALGLGVACVR